MNDYDNLIDNITEDIINIFDIKIPIVDIEDIVMKLGGRIETSDKTLGYIYKNDKEFVIVISLCPNKERKNLLIANGLGHLFLHMGYQIDDKLYNSMNEYYSTNVIQEYQANRFALTLLMPKTEYKKIMDMYTIENKVNTKKIAEYFKVPISAAYNRGEYLGYLKSVLY